MSKFQLVLAAAFCGATLALGANSIPPSDTQTNYCSSAALDWTHEHVVRVRFGAIDNPSLAAGYDDFTAQSTNVTSGVATGMTLDFVLPFFGDTAYAYCDWNQNGVLDDPGEAYVIGFIPYSGPTVTTFTASIVPPAGALPGPTRMRVRLWWDGFGQTPPDPCGTYPYGETEDYTVVVTSTFFRDADGDLFGDPAQSQVFGIPPAGWVADGTDCDDTHATVHPGAPEICDGLDNDCDLSIDEGVTTTFYADVDGDGFGDPNVTLQACSAPPGYVANSGDGCPNDPGKQAPGQCGCGVPDTDSDGDGTANCHDGCPNDPGKVAPGACGCGVADVDSDGDGTPNCHDGCPNDPSKTAPGQCGCGVPDTDSDGDGTANCHDGCPNDPNKVAAGQCGCGVPDTDSDGDGTANCHDGCPNDPNKTAAGQCGCGVADTDSDGDGTANCHDGCPNDPAKIAPGQCGCGVADTDSDGDGTANCHDGCPNDPNKTAAGQCGCGVPDTDSDGDGTANCNDGCPNDPNKVARGACGCGVSDIDTDGDGTPDCHDGCPNDPNKVDPGHCGCGVPDTDSDGDGCFDCEECDMCPGDPNKTAPGVCGCGVPDVDSDGDGAMDCIDGCPNDPAKLDPGQCGCNAPDTDTDADGVADCHDNCPDLANPGQEDCNHNGVGDACDIAASFSFDADGNGVPDECEGAGVSFCFGDGSDGTCPCTNPAGFGQGCRNSTGQGAVLYDSGGTSVAADDAVMVASHMPTTKNGLVFMGSGTSNLPFGAGRLCIAGGAIKRFPVQSTGATGSFVRSGVVALSHGLIVPGGTWNFQAWYRDPNGPCSNFNLSSAVRLVFTP